MSGTYLVQAGVALDVRICCSQCDRKIVRGRTLPTASLETGNTTQRAQYHMNEMVREVLSVANHRGWKHNVKRHPDAQPGTVCAHCFAATVDALGETP